MLFGRSTVEKKSSNHTCVLFLYGIQEKNIVKIQVAQTSDVAQNLKTVFLIVISIANGPELIPNLRVFFS